MTKHYKWLWGELDAWVGESLIDAQQAARIRARYADAQPSLPWARIIFSSIGAILFGLGLILLFAYNWQQMHKFAKLAVVFAALIGVHGAALWCRRTAPQYAALAEGLHVAGTVFFGAGIWLIAQIYHIDEHYPTAFLIWGLGALAMAWALPSVTHGIIACVLLSFWHGSEVFEFRAGNHFAIVLIFGGVLTLAWWQKSRVLLFFGIGTLYFVLIGSVAQTQDDWLVPVLFSFACLLLAARPFIERYAAFPNSAGVLALWGYLAYFVLLYLLCLPDVLEEVLRLNLFTDTLLLLYGAGFAVPALVLSAVALARVPRPTLEEQLDHGLVLLMLILLWAALTAANVAAGTLLSAIPAGSALIVFNLALMAHGASFVIAGSKHRQPAKVAIGCLLIAAIVVTRYMDLFDSLLMRSLAFFIVGAIIFLVGNFYSRHKPPQVEATP